MALVLADRVLETTTTAGSGTITLAGAEPGYQSFSAVGDGNQTYYTIAGDTEWEVGIGTYTASGTTLSRDTVLSSSNSGAKVTFSAGVKKVFVTYPAEKSVNLDVSGNISLSSAVISGVGYPSAASDAATKLYVDTLAAQGITYHAPVKYEVPNTTGNLTATYNNGTAGVSATLTNAGTLAAFVPDGVTASISDRVLVYNQTNGFENGVYTVTVVGNGSTAWVLTRATDADTYAIKSPNSLGGGDAFYVTSGNTGAGETYLCNNSGVITFGSTAISFVQISAAQVYSAGNGISLTNTVISLATPVAVGNGGTGTTGTPNNGELLIGNGSGYTLATLTAGSGVSITNSAGSITLSATGLGGTVTAVTASGPLASSGGTTPNISIANSTGTGSVVLDQGATISSATITAALSASITTITGSSANITTVTGTTAGFSSAAITQLSGTSAGITTVSGTTTTFSSGTITQFGATSATISTVSGTNATYSNGNFTSATVTNASGTNLSYGSATITTGNLTFSSTGQRITGDMSNATHANRLSFQSSTTNGPTTPFLLPNGTSQISGIVAANASDPTNCSFGQLRVNGTTSVDIVSSILGTGTYLPMTFATGGSERMRLDTSGNLGVGTASPLTKLDVAGTSRSRLDVSTSTVINTITNAAANAYATLRIDSADYQFYTGNSEKVRIDSSGNVGIGTASPGKKLDVVGDGRFYSSGVTELALSTTSTNTSTAHVIGAQSNSGFDFANLIISSNTTRFNISGTERMRIDSSGNVGIGTAPLTANTRLSVAGGRTGLVANNEPYSIYVQYGSGKGQYYIGATDSVDPALVFSNVSGTERMRIDSSGNVGIGGTPTAFFNTLKTTAGGATDAIWRQTYDVNWGITLQQQHVSGSHIQWNWVDNAGNNLLCWNRGNVGIGASSVLTGLQVSKGASEPSGELGTLLVTGSSTAYRLAMGYSSTNNAGWIQSVQNGVASTSLLLNPNGGNVGIGVVPNANAKVDVLVASNQRFMVRERSSGAVCLDSVVANNTAYQTMVLNGSTVAIQTQATNRVTVDGSGNVVMTANLDVGGQITTRVTSGATPIVNGVGSNSLQVAGNTTNGAWFSFHRYGAYAINMGLDTSNVLSCGGWSDGANYRWQVDASGNFTARGNVTAYSDERVKKNWRPVQENLIEKISAVKSGVYDRTDADLTQVGVSAQSLREVLPEAVFESNDGGLSVAYGNAALVAVIELAKEVVKLRAEVEALKAVK